MIGLFTCSLCVTHQPKQNKESRPMRIVPNFFPELYRNYGVVHSHFVGKEETDLLIIISAGSFDISN